MRGSCTGKSTGLPPGPRPATRWTCLPTRVSRHCCGWCTDVTRTGSEFRHAEGKEVGQRLVRVRGRGVASGLAANRRVRRRHGHIFAIGRTGGAAPAVRVLAVRAIRGCMVLARVEPCRVLLGHVHDRASDRQRFPLFGCLFSLFPGDLFRRNGKAFDDTSLNAYSVHGRGLDAWE
jgi:hypothetical protein